MDEWYLENSIRKWLACWRFKSKVLKLSLYGTFLLPSLTQQQEMVRLASFLLFWPWAWSCSRSPRPVGKKRQMWSGEKFRQFGTYKDKGEPMRAHWNPWGQVGTCIFLLLPLMVTMWASPRSSWCSLSQSCAGSHPRTQGCWRRRLSQTWGSCWPAASLAN